MCVLFVIKWTYFFIVQIVVVICVQTVFLLYLYKDKQISVRFTHLENRQINKKKLQVQQKIVRVRNNHKHFLKQTTKIKKRNNNIQNKNKSKQIKIIKRMRKYFIQFNQFHYFQSININMIGNVINQQLIMLYYVHLINMLLSNKVIVMLQYKDQIIVYNNNLNMQNNANFHQIVQRSMLQNSYLKTL